jgi:hypothetical protein
VYIFSYYTGYKTENLAEGIRIYQKFNKIAAKEGTLFIINIFAIQSGLTALLRDFRFAGMSVIFLL